MSRDRTVGDTFYIAFTTRAFATGVPTTLAGTPVISAYEDASLTQITAGLTLGVDHDSVTGMNMITVVATGGNGFESGKDYQLVITTGTVGGVSVIGEVVGQFSLGLSSATTVIGAAGAGLTDLATQASVNTIDTNVDSILVDTAEIGAAGAGLTALATQASVNTIDTNVDSILVDTAEIGAAGAGLTDLATQASVNTIDTNVDSILVDTAEIGAAGAGLTALATQASVNTIDTNVDSILVDTAEIGAAGAGLTDLGGMSTAMKAEVNAEADTALTDYDGPTNTEMEARTLASASYFDPAADTVANVTTVATTTDVTNQVTADVTAISGDSTAADNLEASLETLVLGTATGSPTTTTMPDSALTEATNDHYNGRVIIWRTGVLAGQATDITGYNGGTKTFTFTATTDAPGAGDAYVIV